MEPKPAAIIIANRTVSFDAKSQITMASFTSVTAGYGIDRTCLKSFMATLYKKNAKMKMTGSIIAAAGKKIKKIK